MAVCGALAGRVPLPGLRACAAWALRGKAHTFECAGCGRQTSVTAGTVMHGSKLALTTWFQAVWLMATHKNGFSARQMREQLNLGSYKSAWLLCAKLRRAMVAPERDLLSGLVEADETSVSYRTKDDPPAGGPGRSHTGKLLVAGAPSRSPETVPVAPGCGRSPTTPPTA
jgi:hypothetical protein